MNWLAYILTILITFVAWLMLRSFGMTETPIYLPLVALFFSGGLYLILVKLLDHRAG